MPKANSARMNRRDISRLALGASLSPLLAKPLLARTSSDQTQSLPLTQAGNREFSCFAWIPPCGNRAGGLHLADSTLTTMFGGTESLDRFWFNLATR
jgi:hypothetical protein